MKLEDLKDGREYKAKYSNYSKKVQFDEEPKYCIHILKGRGGGYLNKTEDDIIISDGINLPEYQTIFTEEEINAIDPRFMAFAIPVED